MNTYVEGRYFSSDEEMDVLKNPPERMILKRLSDAYPARRTAKQLEEDFRENTDIVKSTIHAKLIELRKKFFIYELNKQQEGELKRRRGPLGPLHDLAKKENPTSAKYVIEEVPNSLYRILPYHLAPGYVQYNEHFETAWNYIIKNQMIEKELFDNLRRSILRILETIFGIVNNSESQPMEISRIAPVGMLNPDARMRQRGIMPYDNLFCSNCGIDHEARNFMRAILLHLLDDVEMTHDFIDFFKKHGIVNTHGYELYEEAYKKFSHETKISTVDKSRKKDELADRMDINRLRIISIDRYKDKSHFLSVTRDGMFLAGVVNSVLLSGNIKRDSIIECLASDIRRTEDLFKDIDISNENSYITLREEDTTFPRYSELLITKIKDIKVNGNYYVVNAIILESPKYIESADPDRMDYFYKAIIEDDTGQIPLILHPPEQFPPPSELMPGDRIKVIGKAFNMGDGEYWLIPPLNSIEKL